MTDERPMTDERLLADFLADRDESAFEALIRRYGPMVLRVCRDVLGDPEAAADAFQATFLVLVRRAGSIRDGAALGRWLYEVALRISRRERRRLARIRTKERQVPEMDSAALPGPDPADRELRPILHQEIGRLPSKLREAIVLCYFQGLTVEAAAREIGCPPGTLKSRLGKGRELLRARLGRRGVAASVLLILLLSMAEEAPAALPPDLFEDTVRAGAHRAGGVGTTRRVASMVLLEEGRGRFRIAGYWGLLATVLLLFGVARFAQARMAGAAPPGRPAALVAGPGGPLAEAPRAEAGWSRWLGLEPARRHCRTR